MDAKNIQGKYGIWVSPSEMMIIEKALDWYENSSHYFEKTSKIGVIKNLQNDFQKIRDNGPQIPKKVEISNEITEQDVIESTVCEECE
jgi:hypothetical protein